MAVTVSAMPVCHGSPSRFSGASSRLDTTGSPIAPSARLDRVTPSWMAEMKRAGLACRLSTRRAARLP